MRFRTIVVILLLCVLVPVLSGCNTLRGMGRDIERAGERVQETVR